MLHSYVPPRMCTGEWMDIIHTLIPARVVWGILDGYEWDVLHSLEIASNSQRRMRQQNVILFICRTNTRNKGIQVRHAQVLAVSPWGTLHLYAQVN